MPDHVTSCYDLHRLRDAVEPWQLLHAHTMTSTNDRARQGIEAGDLQPSTIVLADVQSAGRGRGINTWWSAMGNITATYVVSQNTNMAFGLVPLLAGLAVRRAVVKVTGRKEIALKWPNDLVVGRRKLAGLLCERLQEVDLVGLGLNVNTGSTGAPAELNGRIVALSDLSGGHWDLTDLMAAVAREMIHALSLDSQNEIRCLIQEYERHHWPTGREITVVDTDEADKLTGRCEGINAQGRLILQTPQGMHCCLTGTVASVGPRIADAH